MAKKISAPWLKQYGRVHKKSLKYSNESMYDEVRKSAERNTNAVAIDYFGNEINYGTLLAMIDRAAQSFMSLGAKKGDVISVCSPNVPEAVVAVYAINKIGAVANIFHPLSAPNEIRDYLNLVGSKIFVTIDIAWPNVKPILNDTEVQQTIIISPADSLPLFSYLGYKLLKPKELRKTLTQILLKNKRAMSWETFLGRGQYVVNEAYEKMSGEDVAVVLYSGGTTGKSKGIALTNLSFNATAAQGQNAFPELVVPGNKLLGIMPIFHGFGLGIGVHTILANGMTINMLPKFDAKRFDKILSDSKPNLLVGVPTLYEAMIKNKKIRKMDLSFIKIAISGGDNAMLPLKKEVDKFLVAHGAATNVLLQGYGLTESMSMACVNLTDANRDSAIGLPLADNFFKIVEPLTHIEKPYGEIGEIVISGPTIMKGYVNNDKETNETLQVHPDGRIWLHTGDMGYMDKEGYIYFSGRIKRLIISSGYNIYPNEVESVIMDVPEVLLATVVGVNDRYRGQIAKAFVVLKTGVKPSNHIHEKIMKQCQQNLAKYKWPRSIEFRKTLPKTKIGKVAYTELTEEENGVTTKTRKKI
ncbi:AMP-binding protein [Candidatus Saccharibacteria bacterium]|nr:AMP-binding protein [Candidatus Saccharibacteria bacterium]